MFHKNELIETFCQDVITTKVIDKLCVISMRVHSKTGINCWVVWDNDMESIVGWSGTMTWNQLLGGLGQ